MDAIVKKRTPKHGAWRDRAQVASIVFLSVASVILTLYVARNLSQTGARNVDATALQLIRSGAWLSLASLIAGALSRGRLKWITLTGALVMLFFWVSMAISL